MGDNSEITVILSSNRTTKYQAGRATVYTTPDYSVYYAYADNASPVLLGNFPTLSAANRHAAKLVGLSMEQLRDALRGLDFEFDGAD
jgi:hypothetical protein